MEKSKCIISDLLRDISRSRRYAWDKESKILADKLDKFPSNKVRNALYYSIKGFLKNPHIPIPYKRMLFSAIVIRQVSY